MSSVLEQQSVLVADPYSLPLDELDPAKAEIFQSDALWGYFERLRKEDPVHFHKDSDFGPYWSITKFDDIMYVDTHHELFSSEGGITIGPTKDMEERAREFQTPMFIAMDPPKHDVQRATGDRRGSAPESGVPGECDPRAGRADSRFAAGGGDLRLGG